MTDMEKDRVDGRGFHELEEKSIASRRPPKGAFRKCFSSSCGKKERPHDVPKKVERPPSERFFKNGVRALWADKHCPRSLSGFLCHAQKTQQLKQLISHGNCPHLLLEGPAGAGKKALALALLHDIFGHVTILHSHKPFSVQGGLYPTVSVPIATSRHHVEVNLLHVGDFDKDVLRTIFKEINLSSERALQSSLVVHSDADTFKLIVVLRGERLSVEAQQILRRLMDRYGDTCKLLLCCNLKHGAAKPVLGEAVRSRCQIIDVQVPSQEEMVRVLTHVAKKEDIDLPKPFAARIADHCKDNLRKAIVQLEVCKNFQYPFTLDQRLHLSHWEEDVVEIVADIDADPTPKSLFLVRSKMQAILADCVSPILVLQKLLEEFLLRTDLQQLKKQMCHWAGIYEARLRSMPQPTSQLEAFLAKVMSIYKVQATAKARRNFSTSPGPELFLEYEQSPGQDSISSPLLLGPKTRT